ncbi:hypothetical protein KSP40_PGU012593 [Platanthera guangdongensis]|uniref:adenine phosphoribosyltransferase n=1 Tax=Platanthera guangdongensis TaxID=2320717 RepID=A0ABR2MLJ0_9ASPA
MPFFSALNSFPCFGFSHLCSPFAASSSLLHPLFPTTMSAWKSKSNDPRVEAIASAIRVVPDFPKPGIMFKDITTLLLDPTAFKSTVDLFVERYAGKGIDVVAGFV